MPKAAPVKYTITADGGYELSRETDGHPIRYRKYEYTQLSGNRSIRLLKRIRTYQDDTSFDHFSIEERSLDDPTLSYIAISYVVGNFPVTAPLIIRDGTDESVHLVTKSAWEAIETICMFETPVWIDQVSIKQGDNNELRQQIPLMGEIYSSPRRWVTAVWLGAADDETQVAFDLVEKLSKVMPLTKDIPININDAFQMPHDLVRQQIQKQYPAYNPPADNDPSWIAMAKLLGRTWYTRMWTFQEVVLTQLDSVSIICANQNRRYTTNLRKVIRASMLLGSYPVPGYNDAVMKGRASLRLINSTQDRVQKGQPNPLHFLLQVTADRDCYDPKDKIYALLNVQRSVLPMEAIEVEPTQSPAKVFANVTRKIIRSESSLLVSLSASGRLPGKVHQHPSWVPDYSAAILAGYLEALDPDSPLFSASQGRRWKNLTNQTISASSWMQLLVHGRNIDIVEEIDPNVMPATAGGEDIYAYLRRVLPSILSRSRKSSDEVETNDMMLRIARTVIVGGYNSYMFGLRAFSFILNVASASYRANLTMSGPRETLDDLKMLKREYFEPIKSQTRVSMSEESRQWNLGFVTQAIHCKGRRFAFLKKHGVSLVPHQTQKDDIVAVLHGSSLPVVLRRHGTDNTFHLVGPCYVDGIMLGEAVNWAEDEADSFVLQ